jgi:hypothetical protein
MDRDRDAVGVAFMLLDGQAPRYVEGVNFTDEELEPYEGNVKLAETRALVTQGMEYAIAQGGASYDPTGFEMLVTQEGLRPEKA